MKLFSMVGVGALAIAMVACTDRSNRDNTVSRNDQATTSAAAPERKDDTTKTETYEQPGQIAKTETDKGSADLKTSKKTVTTETDTDSESIPVVEEKHAKADINRLSADEFVKLGLSRAEADRIVKHRDEHGKFSSVDDLRNVPGLNAQWLGKMRDRLGASTG
jgi:competence protein ComEA